MTGEGGDGGGVTIVTHNLQGLNMKPCFIAVQLLSASGHRLWWSMLIQEHLLVAWQPIIAYTRIALDSLSHSYDIIP